MSDPLQPYEQLLNRLLDLQRAGVTVFPQVTVSPPAPSAAQPAPARRSPAAPSGAATAASPPAHQTASDAAASEAPATETPAGESRSLAAQLAEQTRGSSSASSGGNPAAASGQATGEVPEDLLRGPLRDTPDLEDANRALQLQTLAEEVSRCTRCPELVENRTQTVFGVGPVRPRLLFFGEGPGADEDRQGEPFVGKAGQLLNKIIAAMTLAREDVYILNAVKCRPPGNRNPSTNEIACCREYWVQQLEILRPEFICCLGGVAAQTLLNNTSPVGRLRHRWHEYRGVPTIVTYHPAYLLRNEFAKRYVWDDIQLLMSAMGLERK